MAIKTNKPLSVVEIPPFARQAEVIDEENLEDFKYFIGLNPEYGDIIPGTGGLRKVRWAIEDKGKSGGVRVIYYYYTDLMPVLLLAIYKKSDKSNLTKKQANELKKLVSELVKHYS